MVPIERSVSGGFGVAIEERYNEIVRAAREIFARRGFHQASIREIARAADLSLAGLYHYVGSKEELLFLVLDGALDALIGALERALAGAEAPEARLLALVETHLDFGFRHAAALKIINRDVDVLSNPKRAEIAAKRQSYLERGLIILRDLEVHGRSGDELLSATNLLLGMLNGIATRPFVRSSEDAHALAGDVARLFLYGFLAGPAEGRAVPGERRATPAGILGGGHDG